VWVGPRLRTDPRPEVVFTLPLAGEEVSPADARLLVQFSSYMDGESFEDRVLVRYGGGAELRRARWTYDDVRRVLVVDPGEPLHAGATVEVALMPGIADVYAAPLEPPPGSPAGDPARVLRWRVADLPTADATP
jgi:Bacterial Ig-like domain